MNLLHLIRNYNKPVNNVNVRHLEIKITIPQQMCSVELSADIVLKRDSVDHHELRAV